MRQVLLFVQGLQLFLRNLSVQFKMIKENTCSLLTGSYTQPLNTSLSRNELRLRRLAVPTKIRNDGPYHRALLTNCNTIKLKRKREIKLKYNVYIETKATIDDFCSVLVFVFFYCFFAVVRKGPKTVNSQIAIVFYAFLHLLRGIQYVG